MFEFLMSADLGINPIDIGTVTPTFSSAFSTPLPPMTEPLSEETIARFQAAMEKPLADNAILQQALESMVVTKEKPVVVVGDKPVVSDRPQDKVLTTENTKVIEAVVAEKPVIVEKPVQDVVITKPEALPVATPETFKAVSVEKPVVSDRPQDAISVKTEAVVSEKPIVFGEKSAVIEKPVVQTPVLVVKNTKVTEAVVAEKPVVVIDKPVIVEKPVVVVSEKPVVQAEAPVLATENTKVTEKTTIVVSDKPTVVVPETPKAFVSSVNFVAKELPIATPETFKAVVVENKEVAKVFDAVVSEKPMAIVSDKPLAQGEAPILATKNTKGAENTTIVVSDKPAVVETPKTSESSVNYVAKEIAIEKPVVADKSAVVVEKPVMTEEKRPEEVVITAMPNAIPEATVQPIAVHEVKVAPIVSASVEAKVEAVTAAEVLVQAATAVADTMLVSPGLMRGEGEIIVHLKPEVLEATELKISVQSGTMTVEFAPTVEKIATLLTQNQANLVQVLSERVGRYNVVVNVRPSHLKGTRNARA